MSIESVWRDHFVIRLVQDVGVDLVQVDGGRGAKASAEWMSGGLLFCWASRLTFVICLA